MKWLCTVIVVAIAALWGWALNATAVVTSLPSEFVGEFRHFRYEPPPGVVGQAAPFSLERERRFVFRADGTYGLHVFLDAGYEMRRAEGFARVEGDEFVLEQRSVNREPTPLPAQNYVVTWESDGQGKYVKLTAVPQGHEIYLRRAVNPLIKTPPPAPNG